MKSKKRFTSLLSRAMTLALATSPSIALANVYPTNLSQSASTLSPGQNVTLGYLLNEDASNVTVSILNSSNSVVRTITPGAQTKGSQSVIWDGKDNSSAALPVGNYSFRVSTSGAANLAWTQISTDGTLNNFELPRGVAVNRNPSSPYYGRVYVSNARNLSTANGRAMTDAIYMLNSDLSDTGIAGGTGPYNGGVPWSANLVGTPPTPETASPFRLEVGADDTVYITDWSDANGGLWQAPPTLAGNFTEVLDNTGRDESGLNAVHGSISDVVVRGSGANRVIYTADEDYFSPGSIQQYNIGATTTWTDPPSATFFDNASNGNWNINLFNSLAVDKNGNFWYSQNRSNGTDKASLVEIDPNTGFITWDSLESLGSPDPLRGTQGIAYDPVNDLIALATNRGAGLGAIVLFDPTTKTVVDEFNFGATTNTDVAFDNVGNLYVGNRSAEFVHVWSPPNGPAASKTYADNQFSTDSLGPLGAIALTAATGLQGDFNHDNVVNGADFLIWQRNLGQTGQTNNNNGDANGNGSVDLADLTIWKTSFGQTSSSGAAGAVPEPASLVLLVGAAACGCLNRRRTR